MTMNSSSRSGNSEFGWVIGGYTWHYATVYNRSDITTLTRISLRAENAVAATVAMDVTSNSLTNHSSFFVASISTAKTPLLVPLSASHVPTFRFFFHVSYIANVTLEIFYTRSKKN